MDIWRISNHADLSGRGGLRAAGRWHSAGRAVVYCAEHPALALIEIMVHLEFRSLDELPRDFQLLRVAAPDALRRESLSPTALPARWTQDVSTSRAIGDAWLREGLTSLLAVPSALVPHASNWLINPTHADAGRLAIVERMRYPFDPRLLSGRR